MGNVTTQVEKATDGEVKIIRTTVDEEVVGIDVLMSRRADSQQKMNDLITMVAAGEESYMQTKNSLLEQIADLTDDLKSFDVQIQEATAALKGV